MKWNFVCCLLSMRQQLVTNRQHRLKKVIKQTTNELKKQLLTLKRMKAKKGMSKKKYVVYDLLRKERVQNTETKMKINNKYI